MRTIWVKMTRHYTVRWWLYLTAIHLHIILPCVMISLFVWNFGSLAIAVQMLFSLSITDDKKPIRVCKQYAKAFIPPRPNAVFCSSKCKNQYNVYKSRNKSNSWFYRHFALFRKKALTKLWNRRIMIIEKGKTSNGYALERNHIRMTELWRGRSFCFYGENYQ